MTHSPIAHLLSWIVFVPTLGAILVLLMPRKELVKGTAVAASAVTLALSLLLFQRFGGSDWAITFGPRYAEGFHYIERFDWITTSGGFKIEYYLGVDGLSFPLVLLTTVISFLSCLASWNIDDWHVNKGVRGYFCLFLLLETGMLGVFVALDFFLFYVFWEVMLLPMYFLIGVWGGPRKEYAAIKFFLYTLLGSVLMLVVMLAMYFKSGAALGGAGTFDLVRLATDPKIRQAFGDGGAHFLLPSWSWPMVMFVFLYIGFAIKIPVFPFHTWLPDAHVEAPTPISMILAGVLLKMGAYGLLRISYPILPEAADEWAYTLALLGVVNILYGALCAMAQTDFKKLVAYSSISHMGYVLLGIAVMTEQGFQGAMFQVVAHGISSPMCFFLVGVIYDRAHHREINRFGGLWLTMPVYGSLATLGFFASLGLPGLCGFIGEIYVLLGTFNAASIHPWMTWAKPMAVVAAFGVVLTAGYILWLIQRVYLGPEKEEYARFRNKDANAREVFILTPLAALAVVLGVLPRQTLFDFMNGTLGHLIAHISQYRGGSALP